MGHDADWQDAKDVFGQLCETIAALRHPKTGCPWDLEQNHSTLRKYMIEEAYEAAEVMDPANPSKLKEELGDVLLQVVLNAQIASESVTFSIADVVRSIDEKMRRRHPHVFGGGDSSDVKTSGDVRLKWDEIKARESKETASDGYFAKLKPSGVTPSSQLAVAIGKLAKKIDFDWSDACQVLAQVESEIAELRHEIITKASKPKIHEEMSDVLFSLFQLCRHLDIDPEVCAMDGNLKFLRRFANLEMIASRQGLDVKTAGTGKLEELWKQAKAMEKTRP
jgi:MazG family protein